MAEQNVVLEITRPVSSTLAALVLADIAAGTTLYQYIAVKIDTSGNIAVADVGSTTTTRAIGILQNRPSVTGEAARVAVVGVSLARMNETVDAGEAVCASTTAGKLEVADADLDRCIGVALETCETQNSLISILLGQFEAGGDESA